MTRGHHPGSLTWQVLEGVEPWRTPRYQRRRFFRDRDLGVLETCGRDSRVEGIQKRRPPLAFHPPGVWNQVLPVWPGIRLLKYPQHASHF
jgi:hypothetical protein